MGTMELHLTMLGLLIVLQTAGYLAISIGERDFDFHNWEEPGNFVGFSMIVTFLVAMLWMFKAL